MLTLYVLCGIPGSGKSTIAHKLVEQHDATLCSYDTLPGANDQKNRKDLHPTLFANIRNALSVGNVICDDMNITKKRRLDLLSAVSDIQCEKILFVITTPIDECLRRNANRESRLPDFVLIQSQYMFESPSLDEGWDEIIYLTP